MNTKRFVLCALCALGMYAPAYAMVGMAPAEVGTFKTAFEAQKAIFTNAAKTSDERIAAVDVAINVVFDQLLPKASATPFVRFAGFNFEGLTVETAGKNVFKFAQELIKKLYAKRSELVVQKTIAMVKVATDKVTREKDTEKSRELADLTVRKDAEVVAARAAAAAPLQAQINRLSSELVAAQAAEQAALGAKLAAETNFARLTGDLVAARNNLVAEQAEKVVAEKALSAAQVAKEAAEKARDDAQTVLAIAESNVRMQTANSNSLVSALESLLANLSRGLIQPSSGILNFKGGGAKTVIKAVNEAVKNLKLVKPSYSGPNWQ